MKYEDFEKFIQEKCMYETIYDDHDGKRVMVIQLLDAYNMLSQAQRKWQGLTVKEVEVLGKIYAEKDGNIQMWGLYADAIESKLKGRNT